MSTYSGKIKNIEVSSILIDVYDKHGSRYGLTSSRILASQILDIKVESRFLIVRYRDTFSSKQIEVEFDDTYHVREAYQAIQRIIPKSQSQSRGRAEHAVGKDLFGVFLGLGATIKHAKEETQKQSQAQRKYEEAQKKAIENITNSGHLTVTTFVNGREFKRASGKNAVKAVFLAKYARSPHSVESTWEQEWREKYGINDSWSYLQALVSEGYLEEALLGKALSVLFVEQLKEMLTKLGVPTSGSKDSLILRLLEQDPSSVRTALPMPIYALTDKGISFLQMNTQALEGEFIDVEKAIKCGGNIAPVVEIKEQKARRKRGK